VSVSAPRHAEVKTLFGGWLGLLLMWLAMIVFNERLVCGYYSSTWTLLVGMGTLVIGQVGLF
jgi:hypothetical protein